ncbi:uracil-DNA glycosylase [Actinosynnema pretiosum]|uniref:Uracil-DNA glycosylase n=2 Tax=Actinosynnema TaxID=40566 RepID=A0A290Z7F7_9PSEU|nr:uracil-DNA glycosylase [Actinosynnema pretiosum]ATE54938.1 uracil-DNA glycosylase [Actinosynnema pretiosum]
MERANADPAVVAAKHARLGEPHVAPLVALADRIAAAEGLPAGAVPYPDPDFGGVRARALVLLDNPGPRAKAGTGGSGLLSVENDDPAAARAHAAYAYLGVDLGQCLHWNACPFPTVKDTSTAGERARAARWTGELLRLLPALEVVVLLGRAAEDGWARVRPRRPDLLVLSGPHPSNRGINAVAGNAQLFGATMRALAERLAEPPRATG